MRLRLRALFINSAILLVSLVVAALLVEAATRLLAPQQLILIDQRIWRPAETFGWRHRENVAVTVNTGEGSVAFHTDALGHRTRPPSGAEEPAGKPEILILGDSFLEALSTPAEDTIPEVLSESVGRSVRFRNSGVAGWDPNHYLLELKHLLPSRKFISVIAFLFVGNDVVPRARSSFRQRQPSERHDFRLPRQWTRQEIVSALLYPVNDFLETRSHAFILLKNQAPYLLARLKLTALYFPELFLRSEAQSPSWKVTASIALDMRKECQARGIPLHFVLIPTQYQVDERVFERYLWAFRQGAEKVDIEQPNRRLKEEFEALGLTLLDPLPRMREQTRAGARLYGRVDSHLNSAGHRSIAEFLLPAVREDIRRMSLPDSAAKP